MITMCTMKCPSGTITSSSGKRREEQGLVPISRDDSLPTQLLGIPPGHGGRVRSYSSIS